MEGLTISQVLEASGFAPDVLAAYDLEVTEAVPVRKVVRLITPAGEYALKKFKLTTDELRYSLAAMEHVRKRGASVPAVLPTRDGASFVEREDGVKYFVMEWLDGRESKYDFVYDLALVSRGLAQFHQQTHCFAAPFCDGKQQWGTWTDHFLERIEEMRAWAVQAEQGGTAVDRMFAEIAAYCIHEGRKAVELLLSSRYEEITRAESEKKGFCHHDYAHHNVLITGDKQISLIDFDYAISDIRSHDLASLIIRNMKSVKWDSRTAYFIVKSYFDVAVPYEGEERLLHAMIRFPQDVYEVGRYQYVEKNRPAEVLESRLRKWSEQKGRRERFLRNFEEGARYAMKYGTIR